VSSQNTEMKIKLRKDDPVIVVRGKRSDKGKIGKILRILPKKKRVVVEKIHVVKEYVRANPQKNIQGGIVDREGTIPLSSVMYYCRECEQGVRIGYSLFQSAADQGGTAKSGKERSGSKPGKQRICKKCGVVLD
jgi:large subunit ribosomal protein L24